MPGEVRCGGVVYRHVETFKHDFFAATGMYADSSGRRVVVKINRVNDVGSIPLSWIGRLLARREAHMLRVLSGTPGVPGLVGMVGSTGVAHDFVPGHPLARDERVDDSFFDRLMVLIRTMHARDMAYVDLNKRQNVLHGDDGSPHLFDFQISLHLPRRGWRRLWPVRWLLARFQHGDVYHALKHKRRLRPDLLTEEERGCVERLSFWIRAHRAIAGPITRLRRRVLKRLSRSETVEVAGSGAK